MTHSDNWRDFANEALFPLRRRGYPLRAVALTFLLLLGLSIGTSAAQTTSTSKAHVYLLRGAMNVFSLGMDQIADKLERDGIASTVANHLAWSVLADQAAADYKSGRIRAIILVGHSLGASAVADMASRLGELGVPVKLVISLDPTAPATVSGHVDRYVNYYIANGMGSAVDRGRQFSGVLQNVDVEKMPDIHHYNIDKNQVIQAKVISEIRAAAM